MTKELSTITFLGEGRLTPSFVCPDNITPYLQQVLDGEYAPTVRIDGVRRICDIGANCGAFVCWAYDFWPDAEYDCYEPSPEIFEFLKQNVGHSPKVHLHQCAVGDTSLTKLFRGVGNCGETSLYSALSGTTEFDEIVTIPGDELPLGIDILKIDAEGSERAILERMLVRQCPPVIMLEYHSDIERRKIDALLASSYILMGSLAERLNFGVVKYVRRDVLRMEEVAP